MRMSSLLLCATCLAPLTGQATPPRPEVSCRIDASDAVTTVVPTASADPYHFDQVDLEADFRFAAQYLLPAVKLKTYVYQRAKNRLVLLHVAEYALASERCENGSKPLGTHRVYSPHIEIELLYQCTLHCRPAPP